MKVTKIPNKAEDYLNRVKKGEIIKIGPDKDYHLFAVRVCNHLILSPWGRDKKWTVIEFTLSEAGMNEAFDYAKEPEFYTPNDKEYYRNFVVPDGYKLGEFCPVKANVLYLNLFGEVAKEDHHFPNEHRFELIPIEKEEEPKNQTDVVIEITTKELFDNYINCVKDCIWDNYGQGDYSPNANDLFDNLRLLAEEETDGIREMFFDGYTALLLGEKMDLIDPQNDPTPENVEIRVKDKNGKLIGVVVKEEMSW